MTLEEYMRELILMDKQYGQEEELYPLINMLLRENDNVKYLSVRDVHRSRGKGMVREMLYGYASFPDLAILDEDCDLRFDKCGNLLKYIEKRKSRIKKKDDKWIAEREAYFKLIEEDEKKTVGTQAEYMYGCVEIKKYYEPLEIEEIDKESVKICLETQEENQKSEYILKIKDSIEKQVYKVYKVYNSEGKISNFGQLVGELLWYGKVLYTNGIVWKYLEIEKSVRDEIRGILLEPCIIKDKNWVKLLINKENPFTFNCMCVEIGNLTKPYGELVNDKLKPVKDKLGNLKKKFYLRGEDTCEWETQWARLKYNLACINWRGKNTYEQFITEKDIGNNEKQEQPENQTT